MSPGPGVASPNDQVTPVQMIGWPKLWGETMMLRQRGEGNKPTITGQNLYRDVASTF